MPELGDNEAVYEETEVTAENIEYVSKRSGMSIEDLLKMAVVKEIQGQTLRVRYKIVEETSDGS